MSNNNGLPDGDMVTNSLTSSVATPLKSPSKENAALIDASGESSLITLWQSLYAEGKVSTPQMPENQDIPWYIAAMQAFAAWIAALFLLGFMMAAFGAIFERVGEGVACLLYTSPSPRD